MRQLLLLLAMSVACDEPDAAEPGGGGTSSPSTCGVAAECQPEITRYQRCVQSACGAQFRACYGPDYASGIYNGGPCSAWQACVNGCGCNQTCQLACGQTPLTCSDCVAGALSICVGGSACAPAQCVVVDAGSAAVGGCNRLALCCASLFDRTQQVQCNTLYQDLSPAGDQACQGIIPSFYS